MTPTSDHTDFFLLMCSLRVSVHGFSLQEYFLLLYDVLRILIVNAIVSLLLLLPCSAVFFSLRVRVCVCATAVAASSGLPPSSLRRLQRRLWPRTWMSDNSINNSSSNKNNSNNNKKKSGGVNSSSSRLLPRATTRRNLIQVAGAAIASASTLSISDLVNPEAASAAAVKYSSTVTDAGEREMERERRLWFVCKTRYFSSKSVLVFDKQQQY